jgi:hypothetical protein
MIAALLLAAFQPPTSPSGPTKGEEQRPVCTLPATDPRTRLIVAGFYEAESVSTVAVAGLGEETTVADVEIEPGREPLTLVLVNFDPIIYRFSGDTRRVRQLILLGQKGAGATGIARQRIAFGASQACDLPYSIYQGPPGLFDPRIRALFGRNADAQGGVYGLHRVRIGSAGMTFTAASRPASSGSGFEGEMLRFYPGGVATVDPAQVVAARPAVRYAVLPSTAGIVQLLNEGALAPATRADADAWLVAAAAAGRASTTRLSQARGMISINAFLVRRPIDVPVGLCGAHLVTFIAPDPSYLRGDVCHSTTLFLSDGAAHGPMVRELEGH